MVFLPHALLLGLIVLFLGVKESSPRVVSLSEEIAPGEPLSITFNKPLQATGIDSAFTVERSGERVLGTLTSTATKLIFFPAEPWISGEEYRVHVGPLMALQGGVVTESFEHVLRIKKEKLLFLSPESRLMEGDLETGSLVALTPDTLKIVSFSSAPHGRWIAVYTPTDDQEKNRIERGLIVGEKRGEKRYSTIIPVDGSQYYTQALLCNSARAALLVSRGKDGSQNFQYFTVDWNRSGADKLSQGWNISDTAVYEEGDVACSEETGRFLYRKPTGVFVINFLGETSEDLVGVFDRAIGFSPKDKYMLLEKTVMESDGTIGYHSETLIQQSNGESTTLVIPGALFREASFNGNGTILTIRYLRGNDLTSHVEFYAAENDTWKKIHTYTPSDGGQILKHTLSLDGTLLAVETEGEGSAQVSRNVTFWDWRRNQKLPFEWKGSHPVWSR